MPTSPEKRLRIRYTGRVQGVGFRAMTRAVARSFAVTGWVRNEPDGAVTAEIQGDPAEIEKTKQTLASEMARNITGFDETEIPPARGETAFEIAY